VTAAVKRRSVALVIPAYNEEECVDELATRLKVLFDSEPEYDFSCVIVENGSVDSTMVKLEAIAAEDSRFKVLQLARNFRMDAGPAEAPRGPDAAHHQPPE